MNITPALASALIADQFPEYVHLSITPVEKQGHDNPTYRLGNNLLIRMPTAESYAFYLSSNKTPKGMWQIATPFRNHIEEPLTPKSTPILKPILKNSKLQ